MVKSAITDQPSTSAQPAHQPMSTGIMLELSRHLIPKGHRTSIGPADSRYPATRVKSSFRTDLKADHSLP